MSLRVTAAHSSRVKKSTRPPTFKRDSSSFTTPYSDLPRRKPSIKRASSKPEHNPDDDEDLFNDRLDDVGLVQALATDLTLRDVSQAIMYIRGKMWSAIPEQRSGMNSTRTAEVLNYRASMPPIVTVTHVQALLNSPTRVEREMAELIRKGAIRKVSVAGRGNLSESLILVKDLETMIENSTLETGLKERFVSYLREHPTALKVPRAQFVAPDTKALIHAGFLTTSTPSWTTTEVFSKPGEAMRGTMTSINSISRAASGSMAAVGGEGALHAAGGSGGGVRSIPGTGDFSVAIPFTGQFLKLLASAQTHLLSLLVKSKFKELPESMLKQRWDGGLLMDDAGSQARRSRGEFAGILPGRTKKWKQFHGMAFEWILEECVGAGMLEVFNTGSVGRGVRML